MNAPQVPYLVSIEAVGSRVTCNPPPTDTDCDWLALIDRSNETKLLEFLSAEQWEIGGSLPDALNETAPDDRFLSFTKGVANLIVTSSPVFHRRFLAATSVAKRLNLMDKEDRIALFQAVLYANECAEKLDWAAA